MTAPEDRHRLLADALRNPPFPYQLALLERFCAGDIPGQLDVPTGLGKTAVIAIWLVARALGATVPRRLVYVVDRRAVVDQATGEAERLQEWVESRPLVRQQLGLEEPLAISTLRGQRADNRKWLADPSAPAIVVGTVDMIGSRLLFSGYGVSRRMRPYHAGLLGADTLLVLDEAHLVAPFAQLISTIARAADCGLAGEPGIRESTPPFRVLALSATSRRRDSAHGLADEDHAHEQVRRRLAASKRLVVNAPVDEKALAQTLAERAWQLAMQSAYPPRIVVFTDRRRDAQAIADELSSREPGVDVELLVGARRVHERSELAAWLARHGFVAGSTLSRQRPAFLIATAAGEVGIDIDADHLVGDVVPWERMVQRLGRVNRRGEGDARVELYPCPTPANTENLNAVIDLLNALPLRADGSRDASPGALGALAATVGSERIAAASTPTPLFPPLQRAHVESWSMTSLDQHPGRPEVAPWIRGWIDEEPQTTVVFRRHLPLTDGGQPLPDKWVTSYLDAAPPQLAEHLDAETRQVIAWLDGRRKALQKARLDSGSPAGAEAPDRNEAGTAVAGMILDAAGDFEARLSWMELADANQRKRLEMRLSGRTIVVDAAVGGLRAGLLDESSPTATDVGELLLGDQPALSLRIRRQKLVKDVPTEESDSDGFAATHADQAVDRPEAAGQWRTELQLPIAWNEDGEPSTALVIESTTREPAQSEEGRSMAPRHPQLLDEHEDWAEHCARRIARRLALPAAVAEVLALAARLHDEGKRARRWQLAFGVSTTDIAAGRHYGKTTRRPDLAILSDYRHEFGSLPRAEADPRVRALPEDFRDLLLHLIAAHHGHARPLLHGVGAEEPPTSSKRREREIALRFARLERRWGPWGLAWMEALLRAADQQASRRNDEEGHR